MKNQTSDFKPVDIIGGILDGEYCNSSNKEILQVLIISAWTKYNSEDKDTWPDSEAYEYICLLKDWNNQGFAIRICGKAWQIDKWDHVVAYIDPKLLLPSREMEF